MVVIFWKNYLQAKFCTEFINRMYAEVLKYKFVTSRKFHNRSEVPIDEIIIAGGEEEVIWILIAERPSLHRFRHLREIAGSLRRLKKLQSVVPSASSHGILRGALIVLDKAIYVSDLSSSIPTLKPNYELDKTKCSSANIIKFKKPCFPYSCSKT